jgi:hypothetical protein
MLAVDLPEADLVMFFENYGNLPAALAGRLGATTTAAAATASSLGRVQVGGPDSGLE